MKAPLAAHEFPSSGWDRRDAAHLLRRAGFGAAVGDLDRALADGPEATVTRLLQPQAEGDDFEKAQELLRRSALRADNIDGLKAWWFHRILYSANPLAEKMALLWHNHFATSWAKVQSVAAMADQNDLIREHALGSFAKLAAGMSRDVAMLEWLDSNANRKRHPNENFARELMELFTLGVGNYSERDIQEAARAFTGWHVRRGEFWFNKTQHDSGKKTVFGKSGELGGDDIVQLCLKHAACPQFVATKLLKAFVVHRPDAALVGALAERVAAHDFDMRPVLGELLRSRVFFAATSRANLIKSPVELVGGAGRALGLRANLKECVRLMGELGQNLFEPPTVKGWEGGRLWINSATMLQRMNFAAALATGKIYGRLTAKLPDSAKGIAELLLAPPAPQSALAALDKQSAAARLQLAMSLPEYQLT